MSYRRFPERVRLQWWVWVIIAVVIVAIVWRIV
jgi:hypothetical protein